MSNKPKVGTKKNADVDTRILIQMLPQDVLGCLSLIPEESSSMKLQMFKTIIEKVAFTAEDHKRWKLKSEMNGKGGVSYNWPAVPGMKPKKVFFEKAEVMLLCSEAEKLDKDEKLTRMTDEFWRTKLKG